MRSSLLAILEGISNFGAKPAAFAQYVDSERNFETRVLSGSVNVAYNSVCSAQILGVTIREERQRR
jgi:hypothetical protein